MQVEDRESQALFVGAALESLSVSPLTKSRATLFSGRQYAAIPFQRRSIIAASFS